MGHLVPFRARRSDATAKTEALLDLIGSLYQRKLRAKEELPRVLAQLAAAGEEALVLRAIDLWGTGRMEPHEILSWCESAGAAAGIRPVGDRPFA
jgi:hypothetical protein